MTMVAGTVDVDQGDGTETYTPNTAQNAAKALYLLLLADSASVTTPTRVTTVTAPTIDPVTGVTTYTAATNVPGPPSAPPSPWPSIDAKTAQAKVANTMASWIVTYLVTNAVATVTIPTSAAGDGLQTSASAGNPTTAPASPKTIVGVLT